MKFQATMRVDHLNIRREKAGDGDGPIACDVKLSAELALDRIAPIFTTPDGFKAALGNLFTDTGELACADIGTLLLTTAAAKQNVQIDDGGIEGEDQHAPFDFDDATVDNVRIEPKAGRKAALTLRLQVKPSESQLGPLAALLGALVSFSCDQPQLELALGNELAA